jgi:hypothetical protein
MLHQLNDELKNKYTDMVSILPQLSHAAVGEVFTCPKSGSTFDHMKRAKTRNVIDWPPCVY